MPMPDNFYPWPLQPNFAPRTPAPSGWGVGMPPQLTPMAPPSDIPPDPSMPGPVAPVPPMSPVAPGVKPDPSLMQLLQMIGGAASTEIPPMVEGLMEQGGDMATDAWRDMRGYVGMEPSFMGRMGEMAGDAAGAVGDAATGAYDAAFGPEPQQGPSLADLLALAAQLGMEKMGDMGQAMMQPFQPGHMPVNAFSTPHGDAATGFMNMMGQGFHPVQRGR